MNVSRLVFYVTVLALAGSAVGAQETAPAAPDAPAPQAAFAGSTSKIAVMNIDRVAMESEAGKKMFALLKVENDRIAAERGQLEQEIRDLSTKQNSEILSAEARARLQRDIEAKQRDAQRWLEDQQRAFQEKQQVEEQKFQERMSPIVQKVAQENGIGLIIRDTPGLTYLLDPAFDVTPLVVEALNESEAAGAGDDAPNPGPGDGANPR